MRPFALCSRWGRLTPSGPLLSGSVQRGQWAFSVLVHGRCWFFPGSALRVTGTRVTGILRRRETPPILARERDWHRGHSFLSSEGLATFRVWSALGTSLYQSHTSTEVSTSDRLKCSWSADSFLLKQKKSCHSLPGSSFGPSAPGGSTEKTSFFSSCKTTTLSKSKQCCRLCQKTEKSMSVLQTAGPRQLLMVVVLGSLAE